ncbi:MAG: AMP-binding protein, partial [Actinomycetota bacterium]
MTVDHDRFVDAPVSLRSLLERNERSFAETVAVVDGGVAYTYADVASAARLCATHLAAQGLDRGDRVLVLLPNSYEALVAFFGAQWLGLVTVPVSPRLRALQVGHVIADSGAAAVITSAEHRHLADDARGAASEVRVLPAETLQDATASSCPAVEIEGGDLANLLYTSGSTGLAKGVMLSQTNLLAGAWSVSTYLGLTPADRVLAALPWSFDYGLNQVLSTFWAGGTVIPERSTYARTLSNAVHDHRITGLAGVPPMWEMLVRRPSSLLARPLPSLRFVTNSGGALPPDIVAAIRSAHPHVDIYPMYGLTEAFRSTYLSPELVDEHPTSIGRAIPGAEILVLDDDVREVDVDEPGELVHRGPTVALGYWGDRSSTE